MESISGENQTSLRPLRDIDATTLATLAANPRIAKNLRDLFPHPYALEDAVGFIALAKKGTMGHVWAICYQQELAGVISLIPQTDVYRHSAEIGYWLGEPFWGKGIATAAIAIACKAGFGELNFYRIFAGVFSFNEASRAALMKNGFVEEGVKRKAILKNNNLYDECFMARLKE